MGLDVSRLEPPANLGAALYWQEDRVRKFLSFVKRDDAGSFRMTKWKLMEFTGPDQLQDISTIYHIFEDHNDTSSSTMMIAVTLLLFNQAIAVKFKVHECLELFDWAGEGALTAYDLLFMLQACIRALGKILLGVPEEVEREELEQICRDVMGGVEVSLQDLCDKIQASRPIIGVLSQLTPADAAAAEIAHTPASPTASKEKLREEKVDRPEAEPQEDSAVPRSTAASPQPSEYPAFQASDRVSSAPGPGNDEPVACESPPLLDAATAAEPPLVSHLARPWCRLTRAQRTLENALHLQRERIDAALSPQPGALQAFEEAWAHGVGSSLPTLGTSWTEPRDVAPFGLGVSKAVLHASAADLILLQRACIIEETKFNVARSSAASFGACHGAPCGAASEYDGASASKAADHVDRWVGDQKNLDDAAHVREIIEVELAACEERLIQVARSLSTAVARCGIPLQHVRRDQLRLEGAIAYLAGKLLTLSDVASEIDPLRARVMKLQEGLSEEHQQLSGHVKPLRAVREEFFEIHMTRTVLRKALQADALSSWAALLRQLRELRARGTAAGSLLHSPLSTLDQRGDCARTSLQLLDVADSRWRRCEGSLIAARALLGGGAFRYELYQHECQQQLRSGAFEDGANTTAACCDDPFWMYPWTRVLILESRSGALACQRGEGKRDELVRDSRPKIFY
jgi:hypothetical protein